jgi:hypothetical protein
MKKMVEKSASYGLAVSALTLMVLGTVQFLVSCNAKIISPSLPPTNTPTFTHTPVFTATATPSSTPTGTPNETQTVAATETMIQTATSTGTPTNTPTPTVSATPTATTAFVAGENPGDIVFTSFVQNGCSEFSFVSTVNLASGQVIYFTNQGYDDGLGGLAPAASVSLGGSTSGAPNNSVTVTDGNFSGEQVVIGDVYSSSTDNDTVISEGIISYTVGSGGLNAYTPVVIGNPKDDPQTLAGGAVASVSGSNGVTTSPTSTAWLILNHNGTGHRLLAFSVSGSVTYFVGGVIFGPDTWQASGSIGSQTVNSVNYPFFWDSCLPPQLVSGGVTYATDLSIQWANDNLENADTDGNQNQNAVLNCQSDTGSVGSVLSTIVGAGSSDWLADGNCSKTCLALDKGMGTAACGSNQVGWSGIPSTTP